MKGKAMNEGVSIIIPTLNGGEIFRRCLQMLREQTYSGPVQIIIVDSGSTDGTLEFARVMADQVIEIPKKEFHHALTRNLAVQYAKYGYCVLMVQDAIPTSKNLLELMVESLETTGCLAAYGPQVPHHDADCYAEFEVLTHANYLGNVPLVQKLPEEIAPELLSYESALRLARLDNVCSIYRTNSLHQIPFPKVAFGEDMAWAWAVLQRKEKVFYNPQIKVFHSHNRPSQYRFKRAIVDSLNCAIILNRVHESTVKMVTDELLELKKEMEHVEEVLHAANDIEITPNALNFREPQSDFQATYQRDFVEHFAYVFNSLRQYAKFNFATYHEVIEQAAAIKLGSVWGAVYAKHTLEGTLPKDMEQLVKPYCEGV